MAGNPITMRWGGEDWKARGAFVGLRVVPAGSAVLVHPGSLRCCQWKMTQPEGNGDLAKLKYLLKCWALCLLLLLIG